MKVRSALIVAGIVALTSCGDNGPSFVPFLKFAYSGTISGTFDAKGGFGGDPSRPFATAFKDTTGTVIVAGQIVLSGGVSHIGILVFPASAMGSIPVDSTCDVETSTTCTGAGIIVSGSNGDVTMICALTSGSIVLTTNTTARVGGTFAGSGTCTDADGANPAGFAITDGSFEVTFTSGVI